MPETVTLESLAAEIAYLKAAIHELLNRVPGRLGPDFTAGAPAAAPYARYPEGPRIVEVAPHIRMRLVAPVAPDYQPPFYAGILGRDYDADPANGFPFASEPSNARAPLGDDPGQPPRSVEGYPLHYAADGVWLLNADGRFRDLAALEAERAQRAQRAQQQAKSEAEWAGYRGAR